MLPKIFRGSVVQVWHPDSPGIRVYVRRGWWKRFWYNPKFAHLSERHLTFEKMQDVENQATELARILHALYERHAMVHDFPPFDRFQKFNADNPSGRLLQTICLAYLTGGYRLNDMNEDHGLSAKELVDALKLMPIQVMRMASSECQVEEKHLITELQMHAVDEESQASMSITFSDGQIVYIRIDDSGFEVSPTDKSRILYELSDYVNAQLFVQKSQLRVVGAEYWWKEPTTLELDHRSRLTIRTSVWEKLMVDPNYQSHSEIAKTTA